VDRLNWPTLPGETPIDDVSGLKPKGITTRAHLNALEAANILKATIKYLAAPPSRRSAKFDLAWTLRLHKEMFGDVWSWAGVIRVRDLNLGVPFFIVREQLQNMLDDLAERHRSGRDLVEQAAALHFRAVSIHPFMNGNGRWSRMLANIWLKRNRSRVVIWPEEAVGSESVVRSEYIAAIQAADKGDDLPLLEMHRRFLSDR
jgi:Fic-DOC domain mobile mystery protein B